MEPKFKRLFFDIETSPNMVFSWNVGNKLSIGYDNIIQERAIICICWKWEHEKKVHSLTWDKGCDKKMLEKFIKVMNEAGEILGHNSINFDEKWVRTRCLFHNIPMFPSYQSLDTLRLARSGFRFNSNRLDYIGKYLNLGEKMDNGGLRTWKEIVLNNSQVAMDRMVKYCKKDVLLLENIYKRLKRYTHHKTHIGVIMGKGKCSCPECGSDKTHVSKTRYSATGAVKKQLECKSCRKYFTVSEKEYNKHLEAA